MQSIKSILVCGVLLAVVATDAQAVVMNWSAVGNPGNANDPTVMIDGTTGYGSVPYSYNIGTCDVTNNQYVEFLNAKDPSGLNPLGLYNSDMGNTTFGGISFNNLNPAGSMYGVISGDGNHPVNYVTWYDAVRFANWLNNGQGSGDTETGAYTLLGGTPTPSNGLSITRNAGATIVLPSENEWYKAAYNNPGDSTYNLYPTSTNSPPIASGPTALANHANIRPGGPFHPTDVGAYTGTTSPYGAFDMGGNVYQWNETLIDPSFRGTRGGTFFSSQSSILLSLNRGFGNPTLDSLSIGFRVASLSVPEPSTGILAVIAGAMLWWWRKRFK